jgi:hypothetical protein
VAALCQRSGTAETDANVTDLARRISEPVHLASPQASAE